MVFKFYKYGSLFDFIFERKSKNFPIPYSLHVSFHLAQKMASAFCLMDDRGYIHNDKKITNILMNVNPIESLFPVITDFGIVHVQDKALVASGFSIKSIRAGTLEYCAPEVLSSFKQKQEKISTVKTDVCSMEIVLIELFTRSAWKFLM